MTLTYINHDKDLNETFASSAVVNRNGFFKLLALGLFDMFITLPVAIIQIVGDTRADGVSVFWPGWEAVHIDFSSIPTATAVEWKAAGSWTIFEIRFNQWINPILAMTFFLLFGLTQRKRAQYRCVFWKVMKPFGIRPDTDVVASTIAFKPGTVNNSESHEDTRRVSAS